MDLNFEEIPMPDATSHNEEDDKLSLTRANVDLITIMEPPSPSHHDHHQEREVIPIIPITPAVSEYSMRRYTSIIKKPKLPSTSDMVQTAFLHLSIKPRQSLSLHAIRKFISDNYLPTEQSLRVRMRYVKQYIQKAMDEGVVQQLSGNGLNGSFRFIGKQTDKPKQREPKQREVKQRNVKKNPIRKAKEVAAKERNYNAKRKIKSEKGKIQKKVFAENLKRKVR